jgi:hypothetical protein
VITLSGFHCNNTHKPVRIPQIESLDEVIHLLLGSSQLLSVVDVGEEENQNEDQKNEAARHDRYGGGAFISSVFGFNLNNILYLVCLEVSIITPSTKVSFFKGSRCNVRLDFLRQFKSD